MEWGRGPDSDSSPQRSRKQMGRDRKEAPRENWKFHKKNYWNATKRSLLSRRRSPSSKYPKPSLLLQDYIKSITSPPTTANPKDPYKNSTPSTTMTNSEQHQPETSYSCGSDRLVPDFDFADVLNVPLDTTISLERCNIGYPFDELMMPCDGTGGGYYRLAIWFKWMFHAQCEGQEGDGFCGGDYPEQQQDLKPVFEFSAI